MIGALDFFVGGEVADVVAAAGHLHGMDGNLMAEPGDVAAGGIGAATGCDALGYEVGIGSGIVVEGRAGPVGSWGGGLLGHLGDEVVVIDGDDTALQETFCRGLVEVHDAGRAFVLGVADEACEAEIEDIITGKDEVAVGGCAVLLLEGIDGELDITNSTETGVVGGGAVINN